ncbi:hypothetical protein D3C71_1956030 [compost metagenome]
MQSGAGVVQHQAGAGQGLEALAQLAVELLHPLPGQFVFGAESAPVLAGPVQLGIAVAAQAHHPVDGLAHHLFIGAGGLALGAHSSNRSR